MHILVQIVDALGEAHDAGLVHRDVKPANVMLCTRGGVSDFVKVLDFGLVKDASADVKLTADTSAAMGTPLYMAPEAILAPASVAAPADVYAVGCLAYFLLTGRPPFTGKAVFEVCAGHVYATPEPPSQHADGIPPEVDALVLRCLAKDPAQRPTTRTLANELRTLHHSQSGPGALPSSP
jgi:serine/threonine-protein kinase